MSDVRSERTGWRDMVLAEAIERSMLTEGERAEGNSV